MGMAANIRMDRHWKAEVIIFAVEVVEMISPQIFDVLRVDPAMRVRSFFDEHYLWFRDQLCQYEMSSESHENFSGYIKGGYP